jgi:Spy/CpxP family protein refolding chaperone|uniref:Periplasmic heavy metal sensor n=1 Tax=Desulfobacca acetoxidans TaxID=60893 RepID=A0A7C3Z1C4_9BACT
MRQQTGFRAGQVVFAVILALLVLNPEAGLGKSRHGLSTQERETLVQEVGLTPEQATALQTLDDKFDQAREGIIAGIRTDEVELEKALAASRPDAARIKTLVDALTQGHDRLMQTFKAQRQEEMELMTPVQQGRFLLVLKRWHEELEKGQEK